MEFYAKQTWVSFGSDAAANFGNGIDGLGLPHPRSYGTFPRVYAHLVKNKKILTLEDAIRKMTSWPATRMGINDRGTLKAGMWADVVVFDYNTIEDTATYQHPFTYPKGIEYVIVNGIITINGTTHTGAKAGKIIWGKGKTIS